VEVTRTKKIPMRGEYDVIVCGGGPAGVAAAGRAAAWAVRQRIQPSEIPFAEVARLTQRGNP
jgi:alkyl hydroperoxide reductase subunit AhpF